MKTIGLVMPWIGMSFPNKALLFGLSSYVLSWIFLSSTLEISSPQECY